MCLFLMAQLSRFEGKLEGTKEGNWKRIPIQRELLPVQEKSSRFVCSVAMRSSWLTGFHSQRNHQETLEQGCESYWAETCSPFSRPAPLREKQRDAQRGSFCHSRHDSRARKSQAGSKEPLYLSKRCRSLRCNRPHEIRQGRDGDMAD